MPNASAQRRRAFSLTELLVVIGIIAVLMGILIPVISRSRRSAATVSCVSNLHQIGALYLMYAGSNDDWIPMGAFHRGDGPIPPYFPEPVRSDWNNFLWVRNQPSSAAGPLFGAGLIKPGDGKTFYCPEETRQNLTWEAWKDRWAMSSPFPTVTLKIGYSVRPEGVWGWMLYNLQSIGCGYSMKPLYGMRNKCLFAEDPGRPPYNHKVGSDDAVNALYDDGSVETKPLPGPPLSEGAMDVEEPIILPADQVNLAGMAGFIRLDRK